MSEFCVGIDVGTQGTKVLLVDVEGARVLGRASRPHQSRVDPRTGSFEQDPSTWLSALQGACGELAQRFPREWSAVRCAGVSGQQHGLVVLDAEQRVLAPAKLWCDTSTSAEARELSELVGRPIPVGFTASKALWFWRQQRSAAARARRVLLPHDYLNLCLSGEVWMECGDASGTGFFDSAARRFDPQVLAAIDPDLEACLPPLVAADALPGRLSPQGVRWTSLPLGIALSAGSGDNMCSAIGAGACVEGVAVLSLGTSATIFAHSRELRRDPRGWIAPFCDASGAWLPLLCMMNATALTEEWRTQLGWSHAQFDSAVLSVAAGVEGAVCLPYWQGERVPDLPQACGTLHGLRAGSLEPAKLARLLLEGIAQNLALGLEQFEALGLRVERLRVVGGAAHSPAWQRVLADALQRPLDVLQESESAALGAALQAAWAWARQREPHLELSQVVAPFLAVAAHAEPSASSAALQAAQRVRYRELLERLYGVRG